MQRYNDDNTIGSKITIDASNINYPKLKGNKYKLTAENTNNAWINVEDRRLPLTLDRFIEWMKPPMTSTFHKLYGIIDKDFTVGTYKLTILNGSSYLT